MYATSHKGHLYHLFGVSDNHVLDTFMGVDQRTGEGSKPRIPRVVSKSDRHHGMATMAHRTLVLG